MQRIEVRNHIPVYNWMGMSISDEWVTLEAMKKISLLPWAYHHVAIMPDGHDFSPPVGSVVAMKDAVSPTLVGSDIGCGMLAVQYNLTAEDLPESLEELRSKIEDVIPLGFQGHSSIPSVVKNNDLWNSFESLDPQIQQYKGKAASQCGTLGGGNHYIELCLSKDNQVWLMLHSGSRQIGKRIADKHISVAKELHHNESLEDKNYSVFLVNTPEFKSYIHDMTWGMKYALLNRQVMLFLIDIVIQNYFAQKGARQIGNVIQCTHNYVSYESHFGQDVYVTRKGAISAQKNQLGIIPGSMGAKSFIVKGLGNPDSFTSASHGAGRIMSRSKAKKLFSQSDLIEQTKNVCCRKDVGVLDEIPGAYKSIDEVMANQSDLVEIVAELKQVLTVKG